MIQSVHKLMEKQGMPAQTTISFYYLESRQIKLFVVYVMHAIDFYGKMMSQVHTAVFCFGLFYISFIILLQET